jgi:hypothetical protein
MCPFCISALAVVAAKVAATGGAAILAKVVVHKAGRGSDALNSAVHEPRQSANESPEW